MDMMGYDGYDNTTDSSPQNGGLGESGWEVSFNLARDICMIVSFLSFIGNVQFLELSLNIKDFKSNGNQASHRVESLLNLLKKCFIVI